MKKLIFSLLLCSPGLLLAQSYTLEQCIDMALKNDVSLKNSRLDLSLAEETQKEAFTKYFPSVSAAGMTFNSTEYLIDENFDLSLFGQVFAKMGLNPATLGLPAALPIQRIKEGTLGFVTAVQPVFTGGQIYYGNKLAGVGRDVNQLKISLSEKQVISGTEENFWQIVALKEKLKTLNTVDTMLTEIHKTVSAVVKAGVTNRSDLLRVELQQQSTGSARLKVENGIRMLRLLLCHLTGANPEGFDISMTEFPAVNDPAVFYLTPENGVENRTEKQLLDKSVDAANLQRKMVIGKNLPTVAAGAAYTYHNLMDRDVDFGLAFATVSIPISSWWGGTHAIRRENINLEKAENQRLDMTKMMAIEIESKWNELKEAYQQVKLADKSIESATENLRISHDYYNAGTVSLTALLEAQTLLQQSRDQHTEASASYFVKLSAYMKATGR